MFEDNVFPISRLVYAYYGPWLCITAVRRPVLLAPVVGAHIVKIDKRICISMTTHNAALSLLPVPL